MGAMRGEMKKECNGVWYELDALGHTAKVISIRGEDSYNQEKYEGDIVIPPYVVEGGVKYAVTAIGEGAFRWCGKLESVTMPDSIVRIEKNAFEYCSRLTTLRLPDSIEYIGVSAFGFCRKIASIHIPNKEFEVDRHAFHGCKMPVWNAVRRHIHLVKRSINGITYDLKTTTRLAYVAAKGKMYRGRVVVPGYVTFRGEEYRVTAIGDGAFYQCKEMTELIIEDGVEHIGGCALWYCTSLRVLKIPKSVNSIDKYAFEDCPQLEVIEVDERNPCYDSRGNCNALIHSASNTLLLGGCNTCIPDGIKAIGWHAFYMCERLTVIRIPNSVRTIGEEAFWGSGLTSVDIPEGVQEIGDYAFYYCDHLTDIRFSKTVTDIPSSLGNNAALVRLVVEDGHPIYDSRDNCNAVIETATNTLVLGCVGTSIPDSVKEIGRYAFCDCHTLTTITIPRNVQAIGERAFMWCTALCRVEIEHEDVAIAQNAFDYCDNLTELIFPSHMVVLDKTEE